MTDTETKLDDAWNEHVEHSGGPLTLDHYDGFVGGWNAAHATARVQSARPPGGLDIETIAATLEELGTTDGYDEDDLDWAKRQAGLLRTLASSTQQPSAYCLDCQRAGMRNCQHFDECSGATCVTCHRPLNTPAQPASVVDGWVLVPREPTREMVQIGKHAAPYRAADVYRAMVLAAPQPPAKENDDGQ